MAKKKDKKGQRGKHTQGVTRVNDKVVKGHASKPDFVQAETRANFLDNIKEWIERVRAFLMEVRIEFDKVTWPSRKDAIAMTTAVLAITFFFTAYLGLVDISLSELISFLIY